MDTNQTIAGTCEHDSIERTQISLTSLTCLKINCLTNENTSEGPETWEQEYSTWDKSDSVMHIFVWTLFGKIHFEKRGKKWSLQKYSQQIWMLLVKSFPMVISKLSYIPLFVFLAIGCGAFILGEQSSCMLFIIWSTRLFTINCLHLPAQSPRIGTVERRAGQGLSSLLQGHGRVAAQKIGRWDRP